MSPPPLVAEKGQSLEYRKLKQNTLYVSTLPYHWINITMECPSGSEKEDHHQNTGSVFFLENMGHPQPIKIVVIKKCPILL